MSLCSTVLKPQLENLCASTKDPTSRNWGPTQPKIKSKLHQCLNKFRSVQLFSRVRLFATPWTTARQASLSITNSWSLSKLMSIELVMPSNHLILCFPLLLLPSIFLSIRIFSNESVLHIKGPKYWSFSINISPSNEHPGLPKPISKQNPSQIAGLFSFLNNFLNFQKSVNTPYLFPTLHSKYPWHQR